LHQKLGITIIYVTHDQTEAMTLADRIVVLDRGKIQQIGTPAEIYYQPQNLMVATFLGSPPMNAITAISQDEFLAIGTQRIPCPERWRSLLQSAQGQSVIVGIRPENLHLVPLESDRNGNSSTLLNLRVAIVEPLGSETLIRASLDLAQVVQIKVQSVSPEMLSSIPSPNQAIGVTFNSDDLFLFDPKSGMRLA
jgi:multiple sugar transport system ATP-binding protein